MVPLTGKGTLSPECAPFTKEFVFSPFLLYSPIMPSFEVMDDNGRNTGTERTYEAGYAYVRAPEYRKKRRDYVHIQKLRIGSVLSYALISS